MSGKTKRLKKIKPLRSESADAPERINCEIKNTRNKQLRLCHDEVAKIHARRTTSEDRHVLFVANGSTIFINSYRGLAPAMNKASSLNHGGEPPQAKKHF